MALFFKKSQKNQNKSSQETDMTVETGGIYEPHIDSYSRDIKKLLAKNLADFTDWWDGGKFAGSLGPVSSWTIVDYWTLRKRSMKLFRTNIYAKGVIRRLIQNEISTGIVPTPTPVAQVIWPKREQGEAEELAVEYGEKIATEFELYANEPTVFDWGKKMNFGAFQELVRFESLISGDGIIISRIDNKTGLPRWEWVNGDHIMTPADYKVAEGHHIRHGVEFDAYGKRVAYHVRTEINGEYIYERVPTRGKKTGRLISWMVYGSEHIVDDIRGEPFLADSIYMLKDLDRTRDAEVRAALVNAMIPLFIEEGPNELPSYSPASRMLGAKAAASESGVPAIPSTGVNGVPLDIAPPTNKIDIMNPGTMYKAPAGGKIVSFQTNRPNVNYSAFERSVIAVLAWSHGIPPETLMLEYGNNYSAARQANNEFEIYLKRQTQRNAEAFGIPIYNEFMTQAVLIGMLDLPGYLKAFVSGEGWRLLAAWRSCAWVGINRPAIDPYKEVQASSAAIDNGLSTFDIESRKWCGLSFRQVMMTRKREQKTMELAGFIPHAYEDNNGKPAYKMEDGEASSEDNTEE